MRAAILISIIVLASACIENLKNISSVPMNNPPAVPENYSASFAAENYSTGEIELNISHPMIVPKMRWGHMPLKIFLNKTYMRELDLQDLKKSMDEWELNTSGKISFDLTENKSEADILVNWKNDEREDLKIVGGSLILGEAGPPPTIWTGLFNTPAEGSAAEMELLTVYRRWSPATYLRPMHELGHVLGLDHPKLNDISIMHNFSYYGQRFTDDIKTTISELYKTPSAPEMVFDSANISQRGEWILFEISVKNRGITKSKNYTAEFFSGGKKYFEYEMGQLDVGYSQTLTGKFPVESKANSIEIRLAMNETDIIPENNKIIFVKK